MEVIVVFLVVRLIKVSLLVACESNQYQFILLTQFLPLDFLWVFLVQSLKKFSNLINLSISCSSWKFYILFHPFIYLFFLCGIRNFQSDLLTMSVIGMLLVVNRRSLSNRVSIKFWSFSVVHLIYLERFHAWFENL